MAVILKGLDLLNVINLNAMNDQFYNQPKTHLGYLVKIINH